MTASVVDIGIYRAARRKRWLEANHSQMKGFLSTFVRQYIGVAFEDLTRAYLAVQSQNREPSWDFVDLRDLLHQVLSEADFREYLREHLRDVSWYEPAMVSEDQLVELCLSSYISESLAHVI